MKNLNKCETIFFDLEFYVPESARSKQGFCYNPWDKQCKLLGGVFLQLGPLSVGNISTVQLKKQAKSLWLWNHDNEKDLLYKIYNLMKKTSKKTKQGHEGKVSAIMCGIGITASDIPILFELFKRYQILTNIEAFEFQNSFRYVDLSQIAIGVFNHKDNYLYPITKGSLVNKYLTGVSFESGKSVWGMFESESYRKINARTVDEVIGTFQCYESFINETDKLKRFEKRCKKADKFKAKEALFEPSF